MRLIAVAILIFSASQSPGALIQGAPYLTHCDQALGFFDSTAKNFEERFVEMAKTPGQMFQLLYDYKLVFSGTFSDALLLTLDQKGLLDLSQVKSAFALKKINDGSPEDFRTFMWQVFDNEVLLRVAHQKNSVAEISHLQAKRFLEAIKTSPRRGDFEILMEMVTRMALMELAKAKLTDGPIKDYLVERYNHKITSSILLASSIGGGFLLSYADLGVVPGILFGGLVGFFYSMVAMDFGIESSMEKLRKKFDDPKDSFNALDAAGNDVKLTTGNFLEKLETESDSVDLALTTDEGCKTSPCKLSPVQIAYMGHLDVLEIEELNQSLIKAMRSVATQKQLEPVFAAARSLYKQPHSYQKQMILSKSLPRFIRFAESLFELRIKAADALVNYATRFSEENFEVLKKKASSVSGESGDAVKYSLLLHKVEGDLARLTAFKINVQALQGALDKKREVLTRLNALMNSVPSKGGDWKIYAEDIIIDLEELKAL